jgi:2-alkyl-3-oxoalkanoate reductase
MVCDGAILVTGATGALGGWLAGSALADGLPVCAVVRREAGKDPRERLEDCLARIGIDGSPNLHVVEGDILEEGLGLSPASLPCRVGMVIHSAASTEFDDDPPGLTYRTNVDGVRNVLALAQRCRAPLVHFSTAYIAGDRGGRVLESELDVGQGFYNPYELAKCRGESLVRQWTVETGLPAIILRPSIVMGDSQTGRMPRFSMVYDMMRIIDAFSASASGSELRIVAREEATKNLIPVDYFADAAWRLIKNGRPGTYHIVNPRPTTIADLQRIFAELFGRHGLRIVSPEQYGERPATTAERLCHRAMAHYRPYMLNSEPIFDTAATEAALMGSNPALPAMDVEYFRRLLAYARQVNWGRKSVARPSAAEANPVAEYFDVFLARRLNQNLLPDLRSLSSRFAIILRESKEPCWSLTLKQGILTAISRDGLPADCHFTVDAPTFLEIVSGRLAPQQAFFRRRVEISGDVELGLRIASVLAQFFHQFPFVPTTE